MFGGAIGQTGSSTRQELTAWISSLTQPFRILYATDSAAMLSKAQALLKAVANNELREKAGFCASTRNPFGKQWGLQRDGDLWQIAWDAITKRKAKNQDLRKDKGHATLLDIQEGRSTLKDKIGNNIGDELADRGAQSINGPGLVRLGRWLAHKHNNYCKFMFRVHKMIAAVTIAEKYTRQNNDRTRAALLGYDPKLWIKSSAQIRDQSKLQTNYSSIDITPPIRGKHRYSHCQNLYEDIHSFIQSRRWAPSTTTMWNTESPELPGSNFSSSSTRLAIEEKAATTSKITMPNVEPICEMQAAKSKAGESVTTAGTAMPAYAQSCTTSLADLRK